VHGRGQRGGGGIHIAFLQDDLAAAQIGFGQLTLVGLQARIVGCLGLQGGQLIFGGGQLVAGNVLLQLLPGIRLGRRGRLLGGALAQAARNRENAATSR
jgi:hypothetical protein